MRRVHSVTALAMLWACHHSNAKPTLGQTRAERQKQCDAGAASACADLATIARWGVDGPVDGRVFVHAMRRACVLGDGGSCLLASDLEEGDDAVRDQLAKLCAKKVPDACARDAASQLRFDRDEADTFLRTIVASCWEGSARACELAASAVMRVELDRQDLVRGFMQKGCELGSAGSCRQFGIMAANGVGGPRDTVAGDAALERGCTLDTEGEICMKIALSIVPPPEGKVWWPNPHDGQVEVKDAKRARDFYVMAFATREARCREGKQLSCIRLARRLSNATPGYDMTPGAPRDDAKSRALYAGACAAGVGRACYSLGYKLEKGLGGPADRTGAIAAYKQACDAAGSATAHSCFKAASLMEEAGQDRDRAFALYLRGCEEKPLRADENPADYDVMDPEVLRFGGFIIRRAGEAEELVGECCHGAAALIRKLKPAESARADELDKKACTLGIKDACAK